MGDKGNTTIPTTLVDSIKFIVIALTIRFVSDLYRTVARKHDYHGWILL